MSSSNHLGDNLKTEIKRVNGYLKEVVTYFDSSGKPLHQTVNPLMVELKPRDVLQLFVGSFLVAAPLCMTEEVWVLSETLPDRNAFALLFVSFLTASLYIYFNFYRYRVKGHIVEMVKRILATYVITISSIVLILFLIDKLPLFTHFQVTFHRVSIIGFPAIFGAIISDNLK